MCVTTAPATMGGTRAFTLATLDGPRGRHITGYQNEAATPTPNCMLLHFPTSELRLVHGPEKTTSLMRDMTAELPQLVPTFQSRGMTFGSVIGARIEHYGDYDVVFARGAGQMLDALEGVDRSRRPAITPELERMVDWYHERFCDYSFVLACFNGMVNPRHPIVVEYTPHSDDLLFIPGLDAHDGTVPTIGQPMPRNFRVAFGAEDRVQPIKIKYQDPVAGMQWAPDNVTGFYDNRYNGPNDDYVLPLEVVASGATGRDLVAELIAG